MVAKEVSFMISHSKPHIIDSDIATINNVLQSGMISHGTKVRDFERACAQYLGISDAIAVSSGTTALVLSLKALGIGKGHEVILPTYVCPSVLRAIQSIEAFPVLCDVGKNWSMTVETVARHVSSRTKAIIVVHIFGIRIETQHFMQFGIPIIEDCCQALGACTSGKQTGTIGQFGFFSFHATKCMTTGEGGLVVSFDHSLIKKARQLLDESVTLPSITDMQAALGCNQLKRYDDMLNSRKQIAEIYFSELPKEYTEPLNQFRENSIFFRFPLYFNGNLCFDKIALEFEKQGVMVRKGVDTLLHRLLGYADAKFPNATDRFNRTLSLPIYPALTNSEIQVILSVCKNILK